jgi:hypothetical protein
VWVRVRVCVCGGVRVWQVPLDYQSAGQIRDDKIFEEIVTKLPAGVSLKVA